MQGGQGEGGVQEEAEGGGQELKKDSCIQGFFNFYTFQFFCY